MKTKKQPDLILRPVRPMSALAVEYRKSLDKLIDEMNDSVLYWLQAEYKKTGIAQDFDSIGQTIMRVLLPYLNAFSKWLESLADWFNQNPDKVEEAISAFIEGVRTIADWANQAADAVGGWSNVIKVLVGATVGGMLISWFGSLIGFATSLASLSFNPALLAALAGMGGYWVGKQLAETETGKEAVSRTADALYWLNDRGTHWASDGKFFWSRMEMLEYEEQLKINAEKADGRRNVPVLQASMPQSVSIADVAPQQIQTYASTPESQRYRIGQQNLQKLAPLFAQVEQQYNLPAGLLHNMARTESGGFPDRVSPVGAKGLLQFMPGTQADMGLSDTDVFDPGKSAWAAGKYMRWLLDQHNGNLSEAVAAYNWGTGNVQRRGLGAAPTETRNYLREVLGDMQVGSGASAQRAAVVNNDHSQVTNINGPLTVQSNAQSVQALSQDIHNNYGQQTALSYASGVNY